MLNMVIIIIIIIIIIITIIVDQNMKIRNQYRIKYKTFYTICSCYMSPVSRSPLISQVSGLPRTHHLTQVNPRFTRVSLTLLPMAGNKNIW